MELQGSRLASAALMWWSGFKDALRFDRVYVFCNRSRIVRVKAGQCFLLNGFIFLGSVLALQRLVTPTLNWLLNFPTQSAGGDSSAFFERLQSVLIGICYIFYLYPLYIVSFIINCSWYNDIAQHAFKATKETERQEEIISHNKSSKSPPVTAVEGFVLAIGEQIYSVVMVSAFFIEVFLASFIPYVGSLFYFVLLSWLYAYYCFDYKWGFARWSLERRLTFFESNWAFFSGFGSPCVLATFFLSPLVSAGVMAVLFPLFVLIATSSNPQEIVSSTTGSSSLGRLPIFYLANACSLPLLRLVQRHFPSIAKRH